MKPERLQIADGGCKDGVSTAGRRRSVRRSSMRSKNKSSRLQRLASMPGHYEYVIKSNKIN